VHDNLQYLKREYDPLLQPLGRREGVDLTYSEMLPEADLLLWGFVIPLAWLQAFRHIIMTRKAPEPMEGSFPGFKSESNNLATGGSVEYSMHLKQQQPSPASTPPKLTIHYDQSISGLPGATNGGLMTFEFKFEEIPLDETTERRALSRIFFDDDVIRDLFPENICIVTYKNKRYPRVIVVQDDCFTMFYFMRTEYIGLEIQYEFWVCDVDYDKWESPLPGAGRLRVVNRKWVPIFGTGHALAFAMGAHKRLGAGSLIALLDEHLIMEICSFMLQDLSIEESTRLIQNQVNRRRLRSGLDQLV
jgi:hypothetical protein